MVQCGAIKTVRDLLSTGLLEGAPVTYNLSAQQAELKGFIKDGGYVCACSSCDYSGQVLSALQFEKHAGAASHNQNNNIFLDNGVSLYEASHRLRNVPAQFIGDEIRKVTGVSPNSVGRSLVACQGSNELGGLRVTEMPLESVEASQASNESGTLQISDAPSEAPHACHSDSRPRSFDTMPNISPAESDTMVGIEEPAIEEVQEAADDKLGNNDLLSTPVKGLTTPTKVNPESVLKDVRGLLATGLLEGLGITYKKKGAELNGILQDQGYLCGCSACKYSNVLTACEFEKHAGESSSNQNDHIFLDCGITLYKLVQELKGTSLHLLGDVIQEKIGLPPNLTEYENRKASFQVEDDDPDAITDNPSSILSSQESALEGTTDPALATPTNSLEKSACGWSMNMDWSTVGKSRSQRQFKRHTSDSTSTLSASSEAALSDAAPGTFMKNSFEETPGGSDPALNTSQSFAGSIPATDIEDLSSNHSIHECSKTGNKSKLRDNGLHQLIFKEGGLPDGTVLTYQSKGQILITGHKRGTCIVCGCHKQEFSPSQFEAHAGKGSKRQPYRSIYTPDGMTLHQLSVELHRGLKLSETGYVDERPYTSHSSSGAESSTAVTLTIIPLKRILQKPVVEFEKCCYCKKGDTILRRLAESTIFFCNQCERPWHVSCYNKANPLEFPERSEGNSQTKTLKEILEEYAEFDFLCGQKCWLLRASLDQMLEKIGEKAFPEKGSIKSGEASACWQLFSGRDPRNDVKQLIPRVIAILEDGFRETTAHDSDIISNMVNAKLVNGGMDFRGMCCAVITVKSVVVSAAILKVSTEEAAELVLVATHSKWRRKGYFRILLGQIEAKLRDLKVRLLTAPVDPEMQSIWTEKLGFTILSEEQKKTLLVAHPIAMFENLSLVQKSLSDEGSCAHI